MENQLTLIVPIKVKSEYRGEVRSLLLDLARQTRKEEGNIQYIVHEVSDHKNEFMIYEVWKSQEALAFHMQQPYLIKFLEGETKFLRERVSSTFCKAIEA
ncbi:MAG: putative quinol monooxygenase [Victivallaceae bacterium]